MLDSFRSRNLQAPQASEPIRPTALKRIGHLFGFGILDPRIMSYALGTFLCGLGVGLSIDAFLRTRHAPADWLAWSGIGLLMLGNIIGNVSHSSLKKGARQKLNIEATRHEQEATCPKK